MCTVVLGWRITANAPLILAANRDERRGRPAAPPERWTDRNVPIFAPRDLEAGGTWLGVNSLGLLVAITNRFGAPRDPSRQSRGQLVADALSFARADDAAQSVAAIEPARHNPFHLMIADRDAASLIWHDGARIQGRGLERGWHVLTERSLSAEAPVRERFLSSEVARLGSSALELEAFLPLLRVHGEPGDSGLGGLDRTCVHLDQLDYGTRSSTLIRIAEPIDQSRMLHAEGPPCRTPYADLSGELVRMLEEPAR